MYPFHNVPAILYASRRIISAYISAAQLIMITRFINRILLQISFRIWIKALTLSILLIPSFSSAADVVSLQSINIKPYNEVLKGFRDACGCSVEPIVITGLGHSALSRKIAEANPSLVLTIGMDAYNKAKSINHYPTIYSMILDPTDIAADRSDTTGVTMNISPGSQLETIKRVLPLTRRVGLLYDPSRTAGFVNRAGDAATAEGITLVIKEVHTSEEVPAILRSMRESTVDALWMIPDLTVVTPETIKLMLLYSLQNNIPVITFSDKYVEMGALMSLSIDAYDTGRQTGEMAREFLSGTDINQIPQSDAREPRLTINMTIAKNLKIEISSEIQNEARIIGRDK